MQFSSIKKVMFVMYIVFFNNSINVSWLIPPLYFLSDYAAVNVQNATKPSSAKSTSCDPEWTCITSSVLGARAAIVRYSLEMSMFCRTVICSVQTTMSFWTNSAVLQITNRKRLLIHPVRLHNTYERYRIAVVFCLDFCKLIVMLFQGLIFLAFVNSNLSTF